MVQVGAVKKFLKNFMLVPYINFGNIHLFHELSIIRQYASYNEIHGNENDKAT